MKFFLTKKYGDQQTEQVDRQTAAEWLEPYYIDTELCLTTPNRYPTPFRWVDVVEDDMT